MRASQTRLCLVLVAALCCGPAIARERPTTAPAARFLQDTIERALDLSRPPVSPEDGEKLDALIASRLDWPSLARFAAGRYRAELNADGMTGVTEALARQLEVLARRAGTEWPAMTVALRDLRIDREGNRRILSTAIVPRFGEVAIEWTLAPSQTGYVSWTSGRSGCRSGISCAAGSPAWWRPRAAMPPPSTRAPTHPRDDNPRALC